MEGRGRDEAEGAPLFHCAYHVVLVTLQDVSCFLSIIPSLLTPPPPPPTPRLPLLPSPYLPTHLLLVLGSVYFHDHSTPPPTTTNPVLFPFPSDRRVDLDVRPSEQDTRRRSATESGGTHWGDGGGTPGEFKGRRRHRRKNAVMESRIAVKRGWNAGEAGRLALINDSVLIQRRHHLFL